MVGGLAAMAGCVDSMVGGVVTLRDVCVGCARWARSTGYPHGRRRAKEGAGHTQMHT